MHRLISLANEALHNSINRQVVSAFVSILIMFAHLQISLDVVGVKMLTPIPSSLRRPVSQVQGSRRAMALLSRKLRVSSSKRGKATGLREACSNALAPSRYLEDNADSDVSVS